MADVLGAVYDFLKQYVVPDVEVVRGWQNRAALPNASSYVVMTLLNQKRHGTNVNILDSVTPPADIEETSNVLMEYEVQVDFCGLDESVVAEQASICNLMGYDHRAVTFFKDFDLCGYYTDEPRALPFQDDQQWVVRYSVTLHLSGWVRKTITEPAFTAVKWKIENVDVHHPITNN